MIDLRSYFALIAIPHAQKHIHTQSEGKVMKRDTDWPKMRERKIGGKTYYAIDCGRVDGKRKILTRASRQEAEVEAAQLRGGELSMGEHRL